MVDALALDEPCRCGCDTAGYPVTYGEHEWMNCAQCQEPVITWGAYKAAMLAKAAEQIRRRAQTKTQEWRDTSLPPVNFR
jgi:hypothetical protein